ncbi:MAG: N4-gp56 family major capsid protein [Oscillospiraceae bacterium]|nr:N4-gp56 family major capsid protein [Oscillospiraceae bacterium]
MFKINFQFFAEANVNKTTSDSHGNSLAAEMKTYYDTELIEMAKPNLVHSQFGVQRPLPLGKGKSIEWRRWSSFDKALTPLQEGVTPDGNKLNVSYVSQELRQYGDYTTISDLLELTAVDDVILEATDRHGENMGLTLDTVTRNELLTGLNVIYAPVKDGESETEITSRGQLTEQALLTPELVAKAANFLKVSNAPKIDGSYIAIVHPYVAYDLMRHPEFMDIHKYSDAVKQLFDGEIGKLYGVRFVESTEAKIFEGEALTAASANLTAGAALSKSSGSGMSTLTSGTAIAAGDRILEANEEEPVLLNVGGETFLCIGAQEGAAGSAKLHIQQPHGAIESGATVYPGGAGKNNLPVFACIFLGKGAYGNVDLQDSSEVIVKQKGSSGASDPLNQRSTVGWKSTYAAKILIPEYLVRVECGSSFSNEAKGN